MTELPVRLLWDGTAATAEEAATVWVDLDGPLAVVRIDAPFHGDPPPEDPPGRLDGLWEYEVVECFLRGTGGAYVELEAGPHGHWLALGLSSYRQVRTRHVDVDARFHLDGARWRAELRVERAALPPGPWSANAFAIHGPRGNRRYLVHRPTGADRPDFHASGGDVDIETAPDIDDSGGV